MIWHIFLSPIKFSEKKEPLNNVLNLINYWPNLFSTLLFSPGSLGVHPEFLRSRALKLESFTTSKTDHHLLLQKVSQRISVKKTNTGVFVVFKTKCELKCQSSGITEILWQTFWCKWRSVFDVVKDSVHIWTVILNSK